MCAAPAQYRGLLFGQWPRKSATPAITKRNGKPKTSATIRNVFRSIFLSANVMIAPMSGSQASTISAAEKTLVKRDTGQKNAATKPPKNTSGRPKSLNANGRPRGVGCLLICRETPPVVSTARDRPLFGALFQDERQGLSPQRLSLAPL